jgi:uncharacterized protein (TIGR00251 family)
MLLPSYLKTQGDVVYLHVKAQPRASRNEIGEAVGNELKIKITAPPVDSAANEALVKFLAEVLDCPRQRVQLTRGASSRHKVIAIHDLKAEDVAERLK